MRILQIRQYVMWAYEMAIFALFFQLCFIGVHIRHYVKFTFVVNNANRSPKIRQYVKIVFCEKYDTSHA